MTAITAVGVLFGQVLLSHGFVYDDQYLIVRNPYLDSWKNIILFFTRDVTLASDIHAPSGYYRPLSMALLQVLFHFFGLTAWKYHLFNLCMHAVNAFLVGVLVVKLGANRSIAFLSTLIFAIHPVHIEGFLPIYNYMGLIAATMAMISILCFIEGRLSGHTLPIVISVISYGAAVFLKEDVVVLPLILFMLDFVFFRKSKSEFFKKTFLDLIPFAAVAVMYLVARSLFVESGAAFGFWKNQVQVNIDHPGGWQGWLGSVFLIFKSYIALWIWPNPLTIYRVISLPASAEAWIWFCAEWAILILIGFKMIKDRLMTLGLTWFFVFSLLICNLIPIGGLFAERLIYLPSVGLAWITAVCLNEVRQFFCRAFLGTVFFVFLVMSISGALAFQAYRYSLVWVSDFSIWEHARQLNPHRPYPYSQLAKTFHEQGDSRTAALFFKKAAELTGSVSASATSRRRAAQAFGEAKEYDLAIREYRVLLEKEPRLWDVWFEMGWTFLLSGDDASAEQVFEKTLQKNPDHGWSYYGLAELAFKKGDDEKGRNLYTLALNHSSDSVLTQTVLKNFRNRSKH